MDNSRSNGDECRKQVLGLWTPRRAGVQITWMMLGTINTGLWTAQPDPTAANGIAAAADGTACLEPDPPA